MPLVSGVVVVVFGGLTLALQDKTFIMVKPTIVNALFGTVLLGGLVFGHRMISHQQIGKRQHLRERTVKPCRICHALQTTVSKFGIAVA